MSHYLDTPEHRKAFQRALNAALGNRLDPPLAVDGVLGPKSADAVRLWRSLNGKTREGKDGQPAAVVDNEMLRLLGLGPALITEPGTLGNSIALPIIGLVFSLITKGTPMTWDTIQQVLRIVIYAAASYAFGQAVADGQQFQAALTGVIDIGAFVWWIIHQRQLAAKTTT